MHFFWTNTIWYVLLGAITIIILIITVRHSEKPKLTFAFYISVVGLTLLFESLIKIVFKSYYYYPLIILTRPFDDSLIGNLFSQFFVSSTALVLTVFNRNVYWKVATALIIISIEELFKALGIYEQNWYKTWMTFVGLMLLYWLVQRFYKLSIRNIPTSLFYIYIFLGTFTTHIVTVIWGLLLMSLQEYNTSLISDPITSYYILAILYSNVLAIAMMIVQFSKLRLIGKVTIFLTMYGVNIVAGYYDIIIFKEGWMLFCSTLTIFWMYASIKFQNYLYKSA